MVLKNAAEQSCMHHVNVSMVGYFPANASSEVSDVLMQHPGFDFSGATFNGQAPNPRTFMGGMSHS